MKYLNKYDKLNEGGFFKKFKEERSKDKILKKADDEVKKILSKYLQQDYPFQYSVYVWKKKDENYEEVDYANFKFVNVMVSPRYDWESSKLTEFYLYLYFIDRYGDEIAFDFDKNSPTEKKIDLEYCKPWDKNLSVVFSASYSDFDSSKVDYDDESRYPSRKGGGGIDLVPSDYKTYQFLSELKSTLEMINDQVDSN